MVCPPIADVLLLIPTCAPNVLLLGILLSVTQPHSDLVQLPVCQLLLLFQKLSSSIKVVHHQVKVHCQKVKMGMLHSLIINPLVIK